MNLISIDMNPDLYEAAKTELLAAPTNGALKPAGNGNSEAKDELLQFITGVVDAGNGTSY